MRRSVWWIWIERAIGGCVVAAALLQAGCANTVFHFFSFNTAESPGIEILDYQYGESRQPMARPRESERRSEEVDQAVRMGGDILRPDKLYVKWRIRATGTAYEQTVNLDQLLPRDIEEHEVHFTIDGPRLYVFDFAEVDQARGNGWARSIPVSEDDHLVVRHRSTR